MKNILLALALFTAPVIAQTPAAENLVETAVVRSEEEANKALPATEVATTEATQENVPA